MIETTKSNQQEGLLLLYYSYCYVYIYSGNRMYLVGGRHVAVKASLLERGYLQVSITITHAAAALVSPVCHH